MITWLKCYLCHANMSLLHLFFFPRMNVMTDWIACSPFCVVYSRGKVHFFWIPCSTGLASRAKALQIPWPGHCDRFCIFIQCASDHREQVKQFDETQGLPHGSMMNMAFFSLFNLGIAKIFTIRIAGRKEGPWWRSWQKFTVWLDGWRDVILAG